MGTPIRSCLACRRRTDKASLVRLVATSGAVTVDAAATTPGRGAYLCRRSSCLEAALTGSAHKVTRALRLRSPMEEPHVEAIRAAWATAGIPIGVSE